MDGNNPETQVTNPKAEGGAPAVETPTANIPFSQEQLDQVVSAITKAQEVKAQAVVKSFGNQNGLELNKDDVAQVLAEINKQKKAQEPDFTTLTNERDNLKTSNRTKDVQIATLLMRDELGVTDDAINNVLLKLVDPSSAFNEDGSLDSEKLKTLYTTFLTDLSNMNIFKAKDNSANNTGFKPKVGVEPTADTGKAAEDITRARFGLKPKTN
jgi:hypothetical protein